MLVRSGVVRSVCEVSSGEVMLGQVKELGSGRSAQLTLGQVRTVRSIWARSGKVSSGHVSSDQVGQFRSGQLSLSA